jgi:general stress protein 26
MVTTEDAMSDKLDVERLLAGAARAVRSVRYCWLVTACGADGVEARPMGRLLHDPGEHDWTLRFVTDGRSRKAAALGRDGRATLVFQDDPAEAYLTFAGRAVLRREAAEVRRRWQPGYDAYFPREEDRAAAVFVEIAVERMSLWIRGVTPEPFGLGTTTLERDSTGRWRLAA